ncbi:MAG: DMT family transporter [Paracoccaceae bacterium]|nr:DMT family transporter [Paracoccaceae bacterium]MDG1737551.1 DMT family transporter [Paracoccaceae bacterium]MDG2257479.1 DMT family transporter [Paracoccaceae bacterium]
MELWIPIAIAAAAFQNVRFMLQKVLSTVNLTATGATFSRFIYSAPLVWLLVLAYSNLSGISLPALSPKFWLFALCGGLAQVLATISVVALFKHRNFAVGITLKKTETVQSVLVGFVILGDQVSWAGFGAILIGLIGVLLLVDAPQSKGPMFQRVFNKAAGLGLGAGILFACSAVGYRGASHSLALDDTFLRAALTLACVTSAQAIGMAVWMRFRDKGQITKVLSVWRTAGLVGLTSMAGSLCWFIAFTLENAAYVKAVGQVELVFSFLASVLFFKEKVVLREVAGIAVLSLAIVVLILVK